MQSPELPAIQYKVCRKCHVEQGITEFDRHRGTADGYKNYCRTCLLEYQAQHRRKNIERYRENVARCRNQNPEHSNIQREATRKSRAKYPERVRARNAVRLALKSGRLIKGACRDCGTRDEVQGHHADYNKPLDVDWLCPACHGAEHRKIRTRASLDV